MDHLVQPQWKPAAPLRSEVLAQAAYERFMATLSPRGRLLSSVSPVALIAGGA